MSVSGRRAMSDADPAAAGEWSVWSSMARLFAAAVAVNFAWEMAQMRLYASTGSWLQDSVGCLTASLGDGGMILMVILPPSSSRSCPRSSADAGRYRCARDICPLLNGPLQLFVPP